MIQTFINLFIRPRSVGVSQVIEDTTLKGALGLYTVSWVLLRLVLGDIGVDVLHIAPFINDVDILSYFSTIVIFCIDYNYFTEVNHSHFIIMDFVSVLVYCIPEKDDNNITLLYGIMFLIR